MCAMEDTLFRLAQELGGLLARRSERLVSAESCTGGWIAKAVTDVAGSSAWFERGFVTYSNEAKQALVGVAPATLTAYGAVSAQTVAEMAAGALAASRANWAVAVSGVAGPGGGSDEKPVGTVWLGWAHRGGEPETTHHLFTGDRREVRARSVECALCGLIERLRHDR